MRQMTLVGFLQAQNCTNFVGSWRHPEAAPDFTSAEYYRRIGRALEAGKFHLGFFDDRLAMPDRYGGDHAHTVANGIRCVKMDPVTILTVMGMATEKLGLGSTYTTTYYEPFHVARVFQTLDLMTNGRAAWNVVTSMNDGEAHNMGKRRMPTMTAATTAPTSSWKSCSAIGIPGTTTRSCWTSRPACSRIPTRCAGWTTQGAFFRSRGPFTVPRSAQGHPVIIQAGASGRGRRFAARWAELVFASYHNLASGKEDYAAFKAQVAATGRDPDKVFVATGTYYVVAETRAEAEDKAALIDKLPKEIDQLSLLCEVLNVDLSKKPVDEPWTEEEIQTWTGAQGLRDRVFRLTGRRNPTTRDFMEITQRGTFRDHPRFIGTPKDVADGMEEWFTGRACDGFVVAASHVPGTYEDFARLCDTRVAAPGLASQRLSRHHVA